MGATGDKAGTELLLQGLEALRLGIAVFDSRDVLVYCTPQYRYIYRSLAGIDELIGLEYGEILRLIVENGEIAGSEVLDDPEGWIAGRLARRRAGTARPEIERHADGRWFEIKERPIASGGVIGVWLDVTESRRAHLRLQDSLESVADGLVLWDQNDRLFACNDLFLGLSGAGRVPGPGDAFADVARDFAARALECSGLEPSYWAELWREHHARPKGSLVVRHRDGRWLLVTERRGRDGGGVSVVSDITEFKNREQELLLHGQSLEERIEELEMVQHRLEVQAGETADMAEQLDAAKKEIERSNQGKTHFLRVISHELRTPLHAIIGFAEVIRKRLLRPPADDTHAEYAEDIRTSGLHLLHLVNQLIDLSKIDAGRYELSLAPHDVGTVISDALRIVGRQATDAQVTVTCQFPDEGPLLVLDEQAMRQIMINLLSNAIKFTPANGHIRVDLCEGDGWVTTTVRDNGVGIPAEMLPRLMRPFERIDNELNRRTEGTGLGLAISRALVELHGGTLSIESTFGAGTTVTMRLPSRCRRRPARPALPSKVAS